MILKNIKKQTLSHESTTLSFEDNCFDYIRVFCALTIFLGHFVTDYNVPSKVLDFLAYFVRGVPVFFVLSGFLVARSIEKYDVKEFLIRRFFRIYPSMWVCIAINTVIILIVNPYKPSLLDFLIYIITQFTVCQFFTGGVLAARIWSWCSQRLLVDNNS